jgi:hypothetical protein
MALSTLQIIALRAPQWVNDPRTTNMIIYAKEGLSQANIGTRYDEAIALKVLHIYAVEARNGGNPGAAVTTSGTANAGAVSSETEGDLSRSYTNFSGGANSSRASVDDYMSTQYGQELMKLLRSSVITAMTRRS